MTMADIDGLNTPPSEVVNSTPPMPPLQQSDQTSDNVGPPSAAAASPVAPSHSANVSATSANPTSDMTSADPTSDMTSANPTSDTTPTATATTTSTVASAAIPAPATTPTPIDLTADKDIFTASDEKLSREWDCIVTKRYQGKSEAYKYILQVSLNQIKVSDAC